MCPATCHPPIEGRTARRWQPASTTRYDIDMVQMASICGPMPGSLSRSMPIVEGPKFRIRDRKRAKSSYYDKDRPAGERGTAGSGEIAGKSGVGLQPYRLKRLRGNVFFNHVDCDCPFYFFSAIILIAAAPDGDFLRAIPCNSVAVSDTRPSSNCRSALRAPGCGGFLAIDFWLVVYVGGCRGAVFCLVVVMMARHRFRGSVRRGHAGQYLPVSALVGDHSRRWSWFFCRFLSLWGPAWPNGCRLPPRNAPKSGTNNRGSREKFLYTDYVLTIISRLRV